MKQKYVKTRKNSKSKCFGLKWLTAFLVSFSILSGSVATDAHPLHNMIIFEKNNEDAQGESQPQAGAEIQQQDSLNLLSPSVILMEASTGTVIYEKNATEQRSPASITKIMTLLLAFEALEKGEITLEDEVMTSAHAKSMGGSQVFLEEGEIQTVDTLLKCITVASGNDASVALAEHIAGSEEAFVVMMNEKAKELGMEQTNFLDCCGLSDADEHVTSAKDVALMSRELIGRYPQVYAYTKIWMEDITHVTNKGTTQFTLASTNKLLKQYPYTTGLKTGSTSKAKYCLSATASKDGIDLIAVVMGAPDYKARFSEAMMLLNYGFSVSHLYKDEEELKIPPVALKGGVKETVLVEAKGRFTYLDVTGADLTNIQKEYILTEEIDAPVLKGEVAGYVVYSLNQKELGRIEIVFSQNCEKANYRDYLKRVAGKFLL